MSKQTATYREMMLATRELLAPRYGEREAEALAWRLFSAILGKERHEVVLIYSDTITDEFIRQYQQYIEQLISGVPIQHILGQEWFDGLLFRVSGAVLIPRPETEELVHLAKGVINSHFKAGKVLDVGTGSGCIAIALSKHLRNMQLCAIDISLDALRIAEENAQNLDARVEFRQLDVLAAPTEAFTQLAAIVSNPPYIPLRERAELDEHVREHEPALALFSPDDEPEIFYRRILEQGQHWLQPGGWVFFELHPPYAEAVRHKALQLGYEAVEVRKDLYGRDRMLLARRPLQ